MPPVNVPTPCGSQVQKGRRKRDHEPDWPLRQRREGHADVKGPHPMTFRPSSVEAQPEPVERQGGKEDQDAVRDGHASDRKHFDVQQQHERA